FFFQAEDGIRDFHVTGVQTCALPIWIVENSTALCISKYEPPRDLRVRAVVGRRRPLYFGSRKILLAFLPAATQMALLPEGEITRSEERRVGKEWRSRWSP